jgi:uncharacterized membrane protein
MLHQVTSLGHVLHVGAGVIGLVSGSVALIARKGGRVHRATGTVFFVAMTVMATFAAFLGIVLPDLVNLFIAVFVFYLVASAWMTVRRKEGAVGLAERILTVIALCLLALFAILSFPLAAGLPPLFKSTVPLEGPVLIAIYSFTGVLAIAAVSDVRMVLAGGIWRAPRIARHLWRMCLGLTLATGSAFTNGLPRLLPVVSHAPLLLFLPQLAPLGLMIFWMVRVRFTGWLDHADAAAASGGAVIRSGAGRR